MAVKQVIQTQYQEVLRRAFPNGDFNELPMIKQEQAYTAVMYYDPALKPCKVETIAQWQENPPRVFNTQEHLQGLAYLSGTAELRSVRKSSPTTGFLKHDGTKQLFLGECKVDPTIKNSQIEKIQKQLKSNRPRTTSIEKVNMGHYQPLNYKSQLVQATT